MTTQEELLNAFRSLPPLNQQLVLRLVRILQRPGQAEPRERADKAAPRCWPG